MPFWFNLIQQWKILEKGDYGITFPFLIVAISVERGIEPNESLVAATFSEIENYPVKGYYCEVRWCENINEPVASMKELADLKVVSIKGTLKGEGQVSFGFTTDLMGMFNLNCKTSEECREKLIALTIQSVKKGCFSKNNGVFEPFTESDKEFIKIILRMKNT